MGVSVGLLDLLKALIRCPSVVGAEHSFFRALERELVERSARVTWYEGLLVAQGAEPDSLMISAHADRHGLICTGPNEFQYAAFVTGRRSDLLGNSVSEKTIAKVADRFADVPVMAYQPWSGVYQGSGVISSAHICQFRRNLVFEITGLEHVVAGTPVAFADRLSVAEDHCSGQLDNVLTVAHLVHLFDHGFQGTAFFTAQEESGSSWRYLLEWFRRFGGSTNDLLVLDTSPFPDRESSRQQEVVLRRRDANAVFGRETTDSVERVCSDLGVRYLFKDEFIERSNRENAELGREPASLGSTELGRIVAASEGAVQGTTLQIPTTGYHTMREEAALRASAAFHDVLAEIVARAADR